VYGEHPYPPDCLKSIYFGLNMDNKEKKLMMTRLRGRNVQFFQVILKDNSYDFDVVKVNDLTKERHTYFKEVPAKITGQDPVPYKITGKFYKGEIKATVEIELESKLVEKQLNWIAHQLRNDMFRIPKRLFISFKLKRFEDTSGYWATANFEKKLLKTTISGLTIKQEKLLNDRL
jgi:hypothetical protein